ncbi:hypothetical protein [Vallitalea okinawensis]|uniref:hypothetical protein n=1 Tax=Vallitalea okinawensis TaxID=2078660 RepID=UPI000CFD6E57|nr:hypothetical protein [Vallitalea okinawensis]
MKLKMLFSKELWKNQLSIFGVVSIIYSVIVFFAYPLVLILMKKETLDIIYYNPLLIMLTVTLPIFLGLIYNFLFSTKSINHIHSLPFTRTQIYFSNLFAGITMLILPYLVNGLLVLVLRMFSKELIEIPMNHIIQSTLHYMFINVILFSVSIFVATLSSSAFIHIGLTYSLLGIPALTVLVLGEGLLGHLLYGYPSYYFNWNEVMMKITPLFLFNGYDAYEEVFNSTYYIVGFVYLVLAIGLGLFFYKKRKMETVNDWVAFKWVHVAIKYLAAIIGSIFFAAFFVALLNNKFDMTLLWLLIGGVVGYIIATMFLHKKINILPQWKGLAGYSVVIIILYFGMIFDVAGYISRIPDIPDIEYMEIDSYLISDFDGLGSSVVITDPEAIQTLVLIHEEAIESYKEDRLSAYETYGPDIQFTYYLENGNVLMRDYDFPQETYKTLSKQLYELDEVKELKLKDHLSYIEQIEVNSSKGSFSITEPDQIIELAAMMDMDYSNMSYDERLTNKNLANLYVEYDRDYDREHDYKINSYLHIGSNCINTLQWLKDEGLYDLVIFEVTDFTSVELYEWLEDSEYWEETITDPEHIAYYFENSVDSPRYYYDEEDFIELNFYTAHGNSFNGRIPKSMLLN